MDDKRDKAVGQFNLALNDVFSPFMRFGLADDVPEAKKVVLVLALKLHKRLNGEDIPIVK